MYKDIEYSRTLGFRCVFSFRFSLDVFVIISFDCFSFSYRFWPVPRVLVIISFSYFTKFSF